MKTQYSFGLWCCLGLTFLFVAYGRPYGSPEQDYRQKQQCCRQHLIH
ncbi:MAG: hypothetical protein AAFX01_05965 [Cyanobacteria bacterium J06638_28]